MNSFPDYFCKISPGPGPGPRTASKQVEKLKNEGHIGYVDEFRAVGSSLIGVGAYRRVILGRVEAIKVVQIPARFPLSACISEVLSQQSRANYRPVPSRHHSKQCTLKYSNMARIEDYKEDAPAKGQKPRVQSKKRARPGEFIDIFAVLSRGLIRTFFQLM